MISTTIYTLLVVYADRLSLPVKSIFQHNLYDLLPFQNRNSSDSLSSLAAGSNPTTRGSASLSIFVWYHVIQLCSTLGCYQGHRTSARLNGQLRSYSGEKISSSEKQLKIDALTLSLEKTSSMIECAKDLNVIASIALILQFWHVWAMWLILPTIAYTAYNLYSNYVWKIKYEVKKRVTKAVVNLKQELIRPLGATA